MLHDFTLLAAGLVLIIKGGDFFVAAAVRIAEFLRMPRVVVGSTLVSLTTTSPEMAVSIMSGLEGESDLAVGNAVGSCICNIGLIIGATAALKHVDVHPAALRTPLLAMFAFGAVLFAATLDLTLQRWQGAALVAGGLAYFVWDFWRHFRDRKPADVAEAQAIKTDITRTRWAWFQTRSGTATQFLLGAAIVVLGSRLLVDGAVGVAGRLAIPTMIVGLTVVAIGTSLPEFITAITSSRRAVSDLAVGNVLGANIANLSLVVGVAAVIRDATMDRLTQAFNFPAMLVVMVALLWMLLTDRRVTRREGAVLLALYGIYLAALVAMTLWTKR
jgi:cation:H+ antiporter